MNLSAYLSRIFSISNPLKTLEASRSPKIRRNKKNQFVLSPAPTRLRSSATAKFCLLIYSMSVEDAHSPKSSSFIFSSATHSPAIKKLQLKFVCIPHFIEKSFMLIFLLSRHTRRGFNRFFVASKCIVTSL